MIYEKKCKICGKDFEVSNNIFSKSEKIGLKLVLDIVNIYL